MLGLHSRSSQVTDFVFVMESYCVVLADLELTVIPCLCLPSVGINRVSCHKQLEVLRALQINFL